MIKSIVVSVKPFVIVPGMKLWSNFGYIREHTTTSGIYKSAGINKIDTLTFNRYAEEQFAAAIFPGDLGMPGFARDDRPCVLFRSKAAAEAAGDVYDKWLDSRTEESSTCIRGNIYR